MTRSALDSPGRRSRPLKSVARGRATLIHGTGTLTRAARGLPRSRTRIELMTVSGL